MREISTTITIEDKPFIQSYKNRIARANDIRTRFGNDALACLAISTIRAYRNEHNTTSAAHKNEKGDLYRSLSSNAYILHQLKRPEEVTVLRRVYGKQFILISAFAPPDTRKVVLADKERASTTGRISKIEAENAANTLIGQDTRESQDPHGQNVRDAFPLADVVVDATSEMQCNAQIKRFVDLLFGSNRVTPTHDEYAMYLARCASLRSSDLSRQVGAAIFTHSGEVISLGSNEVPKSGGGTYWTGDSGDTRDHVRGYDPNDRRQFEIFVDLMSRLHAYGHLAPELSQLVDPKLSRESYSPNGEKTLSLNQCSWIF